jgi:hypothetical protein
MMKISNFAVAAVLTSGIACPVLADSLPMDTPVPVDGIETVCTGIGSGKDDPRWSEYPVRIEFSNGAAQYLAGVHLTLSGGGRTLTSLECLGSWVLFRLPAGTYKVTAELTSQPGGEPRSTTFTTPGGGPQKRVEVQFPRISANE